MPVLADPSARRTGPTHARTPALGQHCPSATQTAPSWRREVSLGGIPEAPLAPDWLRRHVTPCSTLSQGFLLSLETQRSLLPGNSGPCVAVPTQPAPAHATAGTPSLSPSCQALQGGAGGSWPKTQAGAGRPGSEGHIGPHLTAGHPRPRRRWGTHFLPPEHRMSAAHRWQHYVLLAIT